MDLRHWAYLPTIAVLGLVLACLALSPSIRAQVSPTHAFIQETHAGTFEEPRVAEEPAWAGAVFIDVLSAGENRFFIATFDSEPDRPNPPFPRTAQSDESWTYAGRHAGTGTDLKPFDEPTRVGALHEGLINGRRALLRAKIDGTPDAQTPYPNSPESNESWDFLGVFEKAGTVAEMKNDQDLVWPGTFVLFEPSSTVYVALRLGHPVADAWPAPTTTEAAGYWQYAGTRSTTQNAFPKPWSDRSAIIGSYYYQAVTPLRQYFYGSKFLGFPPLLGADFPAGAQSNRFWDYRGRHRGSNADPKAFGEPTWINAVHRARIEGKWVTLSAKFEGVASEQTPYPTTLKDNDYWRINISFSHAGTWQDPKDAQDTSWPGAIHARAESTGQHFFRALDISAYPPEGGWNYNDVAHWQALGTSMHAGTVADPKGQNELTWPGAVHVTTLDGVQTHFVAQMAGVPADHDWPLPTAPISNEHWAYLPAVEVPGTFEAPRHWPDYSQTGSVFVDGTVRGQRAFYISRFEGYPADDIDSFATVGQADPNWIYAGRHAGVLTDLKPFDEPTRAGAIHEGLIQGQRALLRSRIDGIPSAATPYPATLASNAYWEFIGVFKHAGTTDDLKDRHDSTWPGALHLDTDQQLIFASNRQGEPGPEGWVYPQGPVSDENWTYVGSAGGAGTVEEPRERNDLTTPGAIFVDQRSLTQQRFFRARFSGFAQEAGATYPSGSDSNEFYEYAGEHAGTLSDPKPFTDPTWPGAIHTAQIGENTVFFRSAFTGTPSTETPYPQTVASNDFWELVLISAQAGTFADPKTMSGQTWPGAIHQFDDQGDSYLVIAQKPGDPTADNWPSPLTGDPQYWATLGKVHHKGTFADPKDFDEVTSQGLINAREVDGQRLYYRSLVQGVPSAHEWAYPPSDINNEYWQYLGKNLPEGTWADPKGATDFTWPGRIHSVQAGDRHLYLASKVDGLPAEHDWPIPLEGENAYWSVVGESRHAGDFSDPKNQQEVTWIGAIHRKQDAQTRRYYRAKVAGNLAVVGGSYPLPQGSTSNEWWEFLGANTQAGTLSDPLSGNDALTWPGNVHKATAEATESYYTARFYGVADASHPFPSTVGASNEDWTFVGKSAAPGTLEAPKDAHEITWPGAIHRYQADGHTYFVRSRINGVPDESGWVFPAPRTSDEQWEYLDMGSHAGTWDDPKPWDDTSWPGAIHINTVSDLSTPIITFYRSKVWGQPSNYGLSFEKAKTAFDYLAFGIFSNLTYPAYSSSLSLRGGIYVDYGGSNAFFEAKKNGRIGIEVSDFPNPPVDTEFWHVLGFSRHKGTHIDPKEWDEYTWPGRIHRYEYGGKTLYFTALMSGTPSEHGWYYPTDESSNDQWAFYGGTTHAGTFSDPHQWNEVTWKNAIHSITQPGKTLYFAAKLPGNSEAEQRPYPDGPTDNAYWRYVATATHAGTIEDPKDWQEPVWPGAVVRTQRAEGFFYYIAKDEGLPPNNGWTLPDGASDNEYWDYLGISVHSGTTNDPKGWEEVTWPGAIHATELSSNLGALFSAKQAGVPADNAWYYPVEQSDNDHWKFESIVLLNGTYDKPKSWNELTQRGLIHANNKAGQVFYYAAKFDGQARPAGTPEGDNGKVFPDGPRDNEWWEYKRKGNGKITIPNIWSDYSMPGDINVYYYGGEHLFFRAKHEGRPSAHNWDYPRSANNNSDWEYLYKHTGTYRDPKDRYELTYPGEIHRYQSQYNREKTLFFRAKKEGYPYREGWAYPTTTIDNENWTYAGQHAGSREDPRSLNDPTQPGAVHWDIKDNRYFIAKFTGTPSELKADFPTLASSNSNWRYDDTRQYTAPGINDFTKPFDQYTWVTAHNGYLDALQPQLARGVRGFMMDLHYDHHQANPQIRMCHEPQANQCSVDAPSLIDALNNVFLPFLRNNHNAVVTLMFESYVSYDAMKRAFEAVPEVARYSYSPDKAGKEGQWSTLQEMIDSDKRLVMFSDGRTSGTYDIAGNNVVILNATSNQVENGYNLGNTAASHNWACQSRYGDVELSLRRANGLWIRPFVLNQFHAWGSSTAHAGDVDNNLTWLQRRVERYCGEPTGWRNPNYFAIDFNQVGDTLPYAAALSQGGFYFYEQNNANRDGDTVCVLPAAQNKDSNGVEYDIRLKSNGCENDEIRSMELDGISAGTRIELYDSPNADRQDDFTIIDVKESVPPGEKVRINSLEGSEENFWYRKLAFHNNGLDGKVSRIRIGTTPAAEDFSDALIVFKEGNNGSQNIVCSVPFGSSLNMKFGKSNNAYGCDNDEARSAYITKGKSGGYFEVLGHPQGESREGVTRVTFKRDILLPILIPSFNRPFENDDVRVVNHSGSNLDGKISYGKFRPYGD